LKTICQGVSLLLEPTSRSNPVKTMPLATTVTGVQFEYSGSLATGLIVSFKNSAMKITPETITFIRDEITRRSPVLMGANRKPLVADSVGETLWLRHRISPQTMSYVLPLLIEEGFCSVSDRKPFVIYRK
jgi:hypothetical protein